MADLAEVLEIAIQNGNAVSFAPLSDGSVMVTVSKDDGALWKPCKAESLADTIIELALSVGDDRIPSVPSEVKPGRYVAKIPRDEFMHWSSEILHVNGKMWRGIPAGHAVIEDTSRMENECQVGIRVSGGPFQHYSKCDFSGLDGAEFDPPLPTNPDATFRLAAHDSAYTPIGTWDSNRGFIATSDGGLIPKEICPDCNGTKQYVPFTGPPEPCKTCCK